MSVPNDLFTFNLNTHIVNKMNNSPMKIAYDELLTVLRKDTRSDVQIARDSGVSQPTIWRLRNKPTGRRRASDQFNKLCRFYGLNELPKPSPSVSLETELKGAIMALWDGSDEHARALIKVLRSLKALDAHNHSTPEG